MATYYRSGVETFAIIGEESERAGLKGTIPDGSTFFAVDQNKYYTYYDGTWYETMPEAARLYHEDVGTDTRPIKLVGGVATIVANELAEDSKVVHNTGDETIAGTKTFTSDPVLMKQDPGIELRSSSSSATTGWRGHIAVKDDNGATNLVRIQFAPSASGYTVVQTGVYKPDRSGNYVLEYRSYSDHPLLRGTSYLPTDSGGNPLAVESSGYMTSGMIAVDPRLVHTTGSEVIAGTKTFNNAVHAPPWSSLRGLGWTKLFEFVDATRVEFEMISGSSIIKCLATKTSALNFFVLSNSARPYTDCLKRAVDGNGTVSIWFNALYGSWARGYILDVGTFSDAGTMAGINILNTRIADGPTEADGYTSITTGTHFEVVQ